MQLTKTNVKRLASISAFGAGVLAVSAPNAEAAIVVITPNQHVGFAGGDSSNYMVDVPGSHDFILEKTSSSYFGRYGVRFRSASMSNYVKFATVGQDRLRGFAAGPKWSVVGGSNWQIGFAGTHVNGTNRTELTPTNKYFLFRFTDSTSGDALRYGWGELSVSFSNNKPSVLFSRFAYDDTGAQIEAGDEGAAATPEPTTFALTGLAALAIGARGVRRWRAARKTA